jgi:hypothetical protein
MSEEGDKAEVRDEREPYDPPTLEVEELYEVLALVCGKVHPSNRQCGRRAKNS